MNMLELFLNRGAMLRILKRVMLVGALLFFGFIALVWWAIASLVETNQRSQADATKIEQLEKRLIELDRKLDQKLAAPVAE